METSTYFTERGGVGSPVRCVTIRARMLAGVNKGRYGKRMEFPPLIIETSFVKASSSNNHMPPTDAMLAHPSCQTLTNTSDRLNSRMKNDSTL
jgi:hypothetical protein